MYVTFKKNVFYMHLFCFIVHWRLKKSIVHWWSLHVSWDIYTTPPVDIFSSVHSERSVGTELRALRYLCAVHIECILYTVSVKDAFIVYCSVSLVTLLFCNNEVNNEHISNNVLKVITCSLLLSISPCIQRFLLVRGIVRPN